MNTKDAEYVSGAISALGGITMALIVALEEASPAAVDKFASVMRVAANNMDMDEGQQALIRSSIERAEQLKALRRTP